MSASPSLQPATSSTPAAAADGPAAGGSSVAGPTRRSPGAASRLWGNLWPYLAALLALGAAWQVAALVSPTFLFPAPASVLARLAQEVGQPAFQESLWRSLSRLGLGFSAATVLGVVLGLAAGASRPLRAFLRALVSIMQSVPPVAWVPLLILILGFGDAPIVVVIGVASLYPTLLGVMNAAEGVNPTYLHVARLLGANRLQLITRVYAPAVLPAIITGLQVSFGNAWRSLIAAEMVGGVNVGIGWSINFAGEIADMKGVLAGIVVIGVLAALLDRLLLEQLKRRLLRWQYR